MVIVTGSNLHAETWRVFQAIVSGNVTDPKLGLRPGSQWIFGAFPDVEKTRPDFPIIVIENPASSSDFQTWTPQGMVRKEVSSSIWAYSKSSQQVNQLADAITNAFQTSRAGIQLSGLMLTDIDAARAGDDILGNQRVHWREVRVEASRVISGA